jgi:hypothetical protein
MLRINRKEMNEAVSREAEQKKAELTAYFQKYISLRTA